MVKYICLYCKKNYSHKGNFESHEIRCSIKFEIRIKKYKNFDSAKLLKELIEQISYTNKQIKTEEMDSI